ncbi:MAG: hypothetical protein SFY96_04745 [Planctomycetota bacterium]|nr:hypothetical protein [Planctomycetota bacterium]
MIGAPSRPPRCFARCIAIIVALAFSGIASAQRLNLGGASPFVSDPGIAAAALERELRTIADTRTESPAISSLARLGADLAAVGKANGEAGSWCVVQAMTIRAHLAALRHTLDAKPSLLRDAVARDLRLPQDTPLTDERAVRTMLRDALAPLLPAPSVDAAPGWWRDAANEPLPESLGVLVAGKKGDDKLIATINRLDARLASARGWWAYRAAADTVRRAVVRAAPLALEPAGWLARGARESATEEFRRAVAAIADAAEQRDAVARLRRLADLNELVTLCGGVDDTKFTLRVGVADFVAAVPETLDEDYAKRLESGLRAARLLREAESLVDESRFVRPLRPGVRVLRVPLQESAAGVRDAIPRLLARSDAMSDPAVLSAINAHRDNVDDLHELLRASDAIASPKGNGEARDDLARIADRLLAYAKDATQPKPVRDARANLRELARQTSVALRLPSEETLRLAANKDADFSTLDAPRRDEVLRTRSWLAGLGADLIDRIDEQRAAWIQGWSDQRAASPQAAARRLDHFTTLSTLVEDLVASGMQPPGDSAAKGLTFPGPAALDRWPGWELDVRVLAAWSTGAADTLPRAIQACIDGTDDDKPTPAALEHARRAWSLVALAGRLNRGAMQWSGSVRSDPSAANADALRVLELAAGMPDDLATWRAADRQTLAVICRFGAEWQAQHLLGQQRAVAAGEPRDGDGGETREKESPAQAAARRATALRDAITQRAVAYLERR